MSQSNMLTTTVRQLQLIGYIVHPVGLEFPSIGLLVQFANHSTARSTPKKQRFQSEVASMRNLVKIELTKLKINPETSLFPTALRQAVTVSV